MTSTFRAAILLSLIGAAAAAQRALERHVAAAGAIGSESLARPLAALPATIGDWRGADAPLDASTENLGDDRLRRWYRRGADGPVVEVWLVHTRDGSDRLHHPEVCLPLAGQREDPTGRVSLEMPGPGAPVQQYRFGALGRHQFVFYWHYALRAAADESLDALQRLHQRVHQRSSSVTIQVFAPDRHPADGDAAREFVRDLDAELRRLLPESAERGRRRVPVRVAEGSSTAF